MLSLCKLFVLLFAGFEIDGYWHRDAYLLILLSSFWRLLKT